MVRRPPKFLDRSKVLAFSPKILGSFSIQRFSKNQWPVPLFSKGVGDLQKRLSSITRNSLWSQKSKAVFKSSKRIQGSNSKTQPLAVHHRHCCQPFPATNRRWHRPRCLHLSASALEQAPEWRIKKEPCETMWDFQNSLSRQEMPWSTWLSALSCLPAYPSSRLIEPFLSAS